MSAVILDFNARHRARVKELGRPYVPKDITAYPDGSWGCSTDTMVAMMRWFETYGFDFDPTCLFEDLASDLCAIMRASALLANVEALPYGSPYWRYLQAVQNGDFEKTKAARLKAFPLPIQQKS
jgi:hypothetical protein